MPRPTLFLFSAACACLLLASDPAAHDWPMWGGTGDRNMASSMPGAPAQWDIASGRNVKWVAQLGSQTYGNPVVAGGQVYIGTNNEPPRNPAESGDRSVLACFRASDGAFLWQHANAKLAAGGAQDWPGIGACSAPLVEGDRLYYVTNRCELVCLDTHGDGHGGAKVVWKFDMIAELGVSPRNQANSSPVSFGGLVIAGTSNGQDENRQHVPAPKAPSMVALDKKSGKLVWQVNSVGAKILDGQWSSPAAAMVEGTAQVVIGEGDGWVRAYEALTGRKLWEFDTNPGNAVWPKTRNEILATPVIWQNKVYIANGQDPEAGAGPAHLYAIDATRRGDITTTGRLWDYDKVARTISTVAIADGMLFIADLSGFLHCLDVGTGKPYWTHDLLSKVWASPMVIAGKVYLGDEDGDIVVLEAAKQKKVLFQAAMGSNVYSTVAPAEGTLFVANRSQLFALAARP